MNKIITISREFGSGGREIGRRLAEAMKAAYYDQEIVAALIERTKKAEEYVRYMERERPLPLLPITTARTFGLSTNYAVTENLNFYMQESKIIQEAAEKSNSIPIRPGGKRNTMISVLTHHAMLKSGKSFLL
ncbi:MAG TPA: cytidylate kinase-like family protein [Candidatus Eisenbergiella intestinipullorum]|nr:cytidylate kinase-like family protein [Candidatus Eisenbergiella intestinipullorum]